MMLSGDCVGGHSVLASYSSDHHWSQKQFDLVRNDLDARWCPLEALPIASQPTRAARRLEAAVLAHQSCAPVLEFLVAHHITLPPTTARAKQLVACAVTDGNCADARAKFHAIGEQTDQDFDKSFPSCAGK
jgi:hypothetical protein